MYIILGFMGVLLTFALIGGLIYAIANKKLPNLRVVIALALVVLIGIGLWGLSGTHGTLHQSLQAPSLDTTWATTKNYWLWILLVSGALFLLTELFSKEKEGLAKASRVVIVVVIAMLFVVLPIIGSIGESSAAHEQQRVAIAAAQIEAITLSMPPGVGAKSRRITVPFMKKVVMTGEDFRFHCLYGDGHEESFIPGKETPCPPGDQPYVYATNLKASKANSVVFVYKDLQ